MKVDELDPEPSVLVELDILEEPVLEVVANLKLVPGLESEVEELESEVEELKVEELLIETPIDLFAAPTMKRLSSSPVMRILVSLRSPDLYDLL